VPAVLFLIIKLPPEVETMLLPKIPPIRKPRFKLEVDEIVPLLPFKKKLPKSPPSVNTEIQP